GCTLREAGDVVALGQDGAGERHHAFHRHLGDGCDRLGTFAGANTSLDVSWAQRALHLNLQLAESGTVAAEGRTQPVVDRYGELLTRLRHPQHGRRTTPLHTDD